MHKLLLAVVVVIPVAALAQDTAAVRDLFEAGQHQQVAQSVGPDSPPALLFVAAQSQQRLGADNQARDLYAQLVTRPESDPWHFIGLSGQQLLDGQTGPALTSARRAVSIAGNLADAHYQLGLVLARQQDWGPAAAAFGQVLKLDPTYAYAHYYGGLMNYRAGRTDLMAVHFEQFLKLAPDAPERPEVTQIMRTIRGR